MFARRFRNELVGHAVVDVAGEEIGTVTDTWPDDGGGEIELMLLKSGRFSQRRWIPVDGIASLNEFLFVPLSRMEIDDAPDAEDHRWGRPADIARAHWARMLDH